MSEAVVYWSNYEQHKTELESNTRHKIYNVIQNIIEDSKSEALSEDYIAGLQCAQLAAVGLLECKVDKTQQQQLF